MANIGTFHKAGGGYAGSIYTLLFTIGATFEPVPNKKRDKSPNFRLGSIS